MGNPESPFPSTHFCPLMVLEFYAAQFKTIALAKKKKSNDVNYVDVLLS